MNDEAYRAVYGMVDGVLRDAVCSEARRVVDCAVHHAAHRAMYGMVAGVVYHAVDGAVGGAGDNAVYDTVRP